MTAVVGTEDVPAVGAATRRRNGAPAKLRRLASAATRLADLRDQVDALRDRVEDLGKSDVIVVDGERAAIEALDAQLRAGRAALQSLDGQPTDAVLDQLDALVADDLWHVLDAVAELLTAQEASLTLATEDVKRELQPWRSVVVDVNTTDAALKERKAVLSLDLSLGRDRLVALVQRAEAGLAGLQLLDAWLALRELQADPKALTDQTTGVPVRADEVHDVLAKELEHVRRFDGAVQLTVLRGPLTNDRFEYTLMLVAPNGSRRIAMNVQDTTTIVVQDRKYFLGVVDELGGSAYRSLRDSRPADGPDKPPGVPPADMVTRLREMGAILYKLVVPDRMKDELRRHPEVPLTITTNDLELPWELMFDAGAGPADSDFLVLRRPVTRMPVGRSAGHVTDISTTETHRHRVALIASVGQPPCQLSGARREVDLIKAGLESRNDKVEVDVFAADLPERAPTGEQFRRILLSGSYDIVHYAGHAAFDKDRPDQSGLLLHDNEICFAQKIQRLMQGNPLVFLNACETARLEVSDKRDPPEGAYEGDPREGLANAFVYGGALACIGTLWPVSDDVAAAFAIAFYDHALNGEPFGTAMLEARKEVVDRHRDDPSSLAFVLYGDPALHLPTTDRLARRPTV